MDIVILGAGSVGFMLARHLIDEGKKVAIIEKEASRVKDIVNTLDCLVINDSGANLEVLEKAGIEKASAFISVSDSDELNLLLSGVVSAEFPGVLTVARVRNLKYAETQLISRKILGIDRIINPDLETANAISLALKHGARSDIMLFEKTKFQMRDILLGRDSFFINKPLKDARQECKIDFVIAVVIREDYYIIPEGDTVLQENDRIYVLAEDEDFEYIFLKEKISNQKMEKILLIGGGTIGALIADNILGEDAIAPGFFSAVKKILKVGRKKLQIIDKDYERCKVLANRFPGALVTCQDVMNEGVLEDPSIVKSDLIIAATGNHELNIITGSYVKTLGVPKAIALVVKKNYRHMANNLNLDVTVSRNNTVVDAIIKVLRKGNIKNIYGISGGMLEVIEFSLPKHSSLPGKRLKDIKFPEKCLILFIAREGDTIIPYGALRIEADDNLVFISERESIQKLENMLAG